MVNRLISTGAVALAFLAGVVLVAHDAIWTAAGQAIELPITMLYVAAHVI